MRLKHQLFLTLILFSGVLIALQVGINAWSFDRGFTNYVVQDEKIRTAAIRENLVQAYQQHQGWGWIDSNPELVREIVRAADNFRNPERAQAREGRSEQQAETRIDRGRNRGREPRRVKLLLVDADRKLLLGRSVPERNVEWMPLKLDETVIGYWGIREPKGLPGELEQIFITQQIKSFGYAAAAIVLLSALLAIALASRIVKPILKVNRAVEHITGGHYQHRMETHAPGELGDLSKNINHMALTLEDNKNARHRWFAEISHELRTPLAVLQGELEAIQDGIREIDDGVIASLHSETLRLGRLINDLHELTLSDVGALNYQMEPVELGSLIRQRITLTDSHVSQAGLTLSKHLPTQPVVIQGDSQRLAQMIDNLLQNSIRYTDAGGSIDVSLAMESDEVLLTWTDSSPGVTDEQLPKLFEAFYRVEESRNRELGGSGLGLSIVKKIITAHQGSIDAFHSDTGGLGVHVRLPVYR